MSKQTATNTWTDGLNKDLNPIVTPNTVLTDNLNGTFITYNGNEFSLQNDMGNVYTTKLSDGFYPIGMTEYGGILYIVSINPTYARYIKAEKSDAYTYEQVISNILNKVSEKDPNYTSFNWLNASDILDDKGFRIINPYVEELLTSALDETEGVESYNVYNAPGNKFEIGSFPSLNPKEHDADNILEHESDFEYIYRPFHNLIPLGDTKPAEFSTVALLDYDINHPVSIEVQPSYDGSVNLILTDDKNVPRLINSGFAVTENGKGKFVKRNQDTKTNLYKEAGLDALTTLINTSTSFTTVDLGDLRDPSNPILGVQPGGQLKGGNYTFYFKFGDEDGNKTDVLCESGIVSIFKGTIGVPNTISGTISNELTDKMVHLQLNNLDTSYSKIFVTYTREYSDLNGFRLVECKELTEPFKLANTTEVIVISGVEETIDASIEELNVRYHTVSSVKAAAQQQNVLFLGNITNTDVNNAALQKISYKVKVSVESGESVGFVSGWDYQVQFGAEYYDPQNIYYSLGYWPNELYRLGIVYIKSDGTYTDVFNLKGCVFNSLSECNQDAPHSNNYEKIKDTYFIEDGEEYLDNIAGVFKTPNVNILENGSVCPLYFNIGVPEDMISSLDDLGIIGYFIVRQKRIPITVCQGFGVGIDKEARIPMLYYNDKYVTESFITESNEDDLDRLLKYTPFAFNGIDTEKLEENQPKFYIYQESYKKPREERLWLRILSDLVITVLPMTGTAAKIWSYIPETRYKTYVIGPKGNNVDYIYHIEDEKEKNGGNPGLEKCRSWVNINRAWIDDVGYIGVQTRSDYNAHRAKAIEDTSLNERKIANPQVKGQGLLSVEAITNPYLQSTFCGTEFNIEPAYKCTLNRYGSMFAAQGYYSTTGDDKIISSTKLVYIPSNTPLKYVDNVGFSTQAGDGINASSFSFLERRPVGKEDGKLQYNFVRGHYTPYIGVISKKSPFTDSDKEQRGAMPNYLYNICVPHDSTYKSDFRARAVNNAEYYAVSQKRPIVKMTDVFGGDCFVNTVTIRMNRNFIDQTAPISDIIVKEDCWKKFYRGYGNVVDWNEKENDEDKVKDDPEYTHWDEINISDLNAVSLGQWITFKCLSNSNLALRSEDTSNVSEMALMGNPRSFYPLIGASTSTAMKVPESSLLNGGYGATVGRRRNTLKQDTPYDKNEFSNRIMFSNVGVIDSFTNGYRVFQGLSYHDYTKQYGSIIKLLPWGNNLFCVFEHGIAILPVNEKALMQTTTEQTIHIYGHNVLPDQMSIISQDFGSIWEDSIIRTPIGIYGVDTSAKKIWRYSDAKGLETLSDMKLQRFLNDNINLGLTKQEELGVTNVKTHFNNYKGDVMFTFYNPGKKWNLCYNERQGLWVTRYSWIPLFSANIDNTFYSMPLMKVGEKDYIDIWKHGRTGIDTQFRPCLWYNYQCPFEFEFVVNDPAGVHKIFENLAITSNNVQPSEIEFQIIGDSYLFNRARIYHDVKNIYGNLGEDKPYVKDGLFTKDDFAIDSFKPMFYNAKVEYDPVLDEYTIIVNQTCKNKETYGVRLGNIQYKEDGWYTNIEPLRYNVKLNKQDASDFSEKDPFASAKIRDKWIKVRIKYKGNRLALISGVTTFENISYA